MAGGISPNTCPSAPGANHPVASLVIKAKGLHARVRTIRGHCWWALKRLARSGSGTAKDGSSTCRGATWATRHIKCGKDADRPHAGRRVSN
jgi:hypothetical protein